MRHLGVGIALLLLGICVGIAFAAKGTGDGALTLVRADEAFAKATADKGLEGWLSYFGPDAKIFPQGQPVVEGLDAVKAFYAKSGFDPKTRPLY